MEWKMNEMVFERLQNLYGKCDVDLFASNDNLQVENYVSFKPYPNAVAIEAFALCWRNIDCYLFPSFSVIRDVLKKLAGKEVRFACWGLQRGKAVSFPKTE